MHAAELGTEGSVELRCLKTEGAVELSHVKLVALPVAGLAVGPQPTLTLKKPGPAPGILTKKKRT